MKKTISIILIFISIPLSTYANAAEFASLAIDEKNGSAYGWSYDQQTLTAAEQQALQECNKRSSNNQCSVVLAWSGEGCGVYRTVDGQVGTAYGWAVASTRNTANVLANREALKRSNGIVAPNNVWACNNSDKNQLKVIRKDNLDTRMVKSENLKEIGFNDGEYATQDGYYSINVRLEGDSLTIEEPNKVSVYTRQKNSEYLYTNPKNDITYGMRVVNESTLEAFKPGIENSTTTLKLRSKPSQNSSKHSNQDKMQALAEKYTTLSQTDTLNTQTWVQCAAVAFGYAGLSDQEAKKMEFQVATLLQLIQSSPTKSSPCDDVISNSTWNSVPKN